MIRVVLATVFALSLAACGGGTSDELTEVSLIENAQRSGELIFAGETRAAYDYLHPDYKDKCSLSEFIGLYAAASVLFEGFVGEKLSDTEFTVTSATLNGNRGTVESELLISGEPLGGDDPDEESWVYEDGEWLITTNEAEPCSVGSEDDAS